MKWSCYFGLAALSCASTPTLEGPAPALLPPPPPASALPPSRADTHQLYRDEVVRVVDSGLGRFLQHVQLEAQVRDGKFAGWIVRALYPRDAWQRVDLMPGDVVQSINGQPIERETQAYDAFVALKTAPRLVIAYERDGAPRTLAFQIIDRPATMRAR